MSGLCECEPREPSKHRENMQTPHREAPARWWIETDLLWGNSAKRHTIIWFISCYKHFNYVTFRMFDKSITSDCLFVLYVYARLLVTNLQKYSKWWSPPPKCVWCLMLSSWTYTSVLFFLILSPKVNLIWHQFKCVRKLTQTPGHHLNSTHKIQSQDGLEMSEHFFSCILINQRFVIEDFSIHLT